MEKDEQDWSVDDKETHGSFKQASETLNEMKSRIYGVGREIHMNEKGLDAILVNETKDYPIWKKDPARSWGTYESDRPFLERQQAMEILAESLEQRCIHWKAGRTESQYHPLAFIAEGLGSGGTSRFLSEIGSSFQEYVIASDKKYPNLAEILKNSIFISVDLFYYSKPDIDRGIAKTLSLRVLDRLLENAEQHVMLNSRQDEELLCHALQTAAKDKSCIFLRIDFASKVHFERPAEFVKLVKMMASLSCSLNPFFVPILAGYHVEDMLTVIPKSVPNPLLRLSLLPLSYASSLEFVSSLDTDTQTLVKNHVKIRQLVADMGGHFKNLFRLQKFLSNCKGPLRIDEIVLRLHYESTDWVREVLSQPIAYALLSPL